jgi:hypothetical protein
MHLATLIAFLVASLGSLVPFSALAESGPGAARLDFTLVIPAMVRVKALVQPDRIAVEERHVSQGYIDIDDASSVLLTSNSKSGYQLSVAFDAGILARVRVRIASQQLDAEEGSGSMDVHAPKLVDVPVRASYRLYLRPQVRAGNYRWPVTLAFSTRVVA